MLILKVSTTEVSGFQPLPRLYEEVTAISRHHIATELPEPLRRRDILRTILDNEPFDIIHFAGHLTDEGFVASQEIIPLDMIVMYIQTGRPDLVFFNTCSSEHVAEMVTSRCASDCIFTVSDVDNEDAIDFSMMFYSLLATTDIDSYKEARDRVDPTGARFRFMPGTNVVIRRGDEVTQRLSALEVAIGGGRLGEPGIVHRLASMDTRIASLENTVKTEVIPGIASLQSDHHGTGRQHDRLLWAIFAASILFAAVIAVLLLYLVQNQVIK